MITVDFVVDGKPIGKERPRVTRHGAYTPARTKEYEKAVRAAFLRALVYKAPLGYHHRAEMVRTAEVYITAFFGVPESWSLKRKVAVYNGFCTKRPDADNVAKVICDALNGVAFADDACVTELGVSKRYCDKGESPRVEVTVCLDVDAPAAPDAGG